MAWALNLDVAIDAVDDPSRAGGPVFTIITIDILVDAHCLGLSLGLASPLPMV